MIVQEDTAEKITERYCLGVQESGDENVQILSLSVQKVRCRRNS